MSFGGISRRSTVRPIDVSSLLGAIARDLCDESILFVFGTDLALLKWSEEKPVLERAAQIATTDVGHATFAFKVPRILHHLKLPVDRILLLTDMQVYGETYPDAPDEDFTTLLRRYRAEVAPRVRTFVMNLQPGRHFMTPPDEHGVTYVSGFSEGLLRYVAADGEAADMVQVVDRIELRPAGATGLAPDEDRTLGCSGLPE
jgi:hypothetical protein